MANRIVKIQIRRVSNPSFRVLLVIPAAIALVAAVWYGSRPMLEELKIKDAHRYQLMMHEASRLHFIAAWQRWVELKEVRHDQVLRDRYHRLIQQWESDSAFRQERNKAEREARMRNRHRHSRDYQSLLSDLSDTPWDRKMLRAHWESASAWEKGLLLREQCVRWLRQEIEDHKNRRYLKGASRLGALPSGSFSLAPSERCSGWIPMRGNGQAVPQALHALKGVLNYYYFTRLMADVGLPGNPRGRREGVLAPWCELTGGEFQGQGLVGRRDGLEGRPRTPVRGRSCRDSWWPGTSRP